MKRLKVGVIGVGRMGQNHCRIYSNLRNVELIGVYDTDLETANKVSQKYDVPFFEQKDSLLDNVEAVSITTPTQPHFMIAMECLDRGVHVLVEKPVTETYEQAQVLMDAAALGIWILQVGHIERFNPAYRELKNVLEVMPPLAVNFRRLSPYKGSNKDVDVIFDLMTHDIDLALDLMGKEPSKIMAYGLDIFSGKVDHAMTHFCYDNGPLLTLTASRVTEQKVRFIEVTTQAAYLEVDLLNKTILVHREATGEYLHYNSSVKYRQESIVERIVVPNYEPLLLELQHFVDCVISGRQPLVSARDGFKTIWLASLIRKSVVNQAEISLEICERVKGYDDETLTRGPGGQACAYHP